jgi:hypothetical protein
MIHAVNKSCKENSLEGSAAINRRVLHGTRGTGMQ